MPPGAPRGSGLVSRDMVCLYKPVDRAGVAGASIGLGKDKRMQRGHRTDGSFAASFEVSTE